MIDPKYADYGVYEVSWMTEDGGNVRQMSGEFVVADSSAAFECAYIDYYCFGDVTVEFIRDATEDDIEKLKGEL